MPRVSVNICCYYSEKFIRDTISSVLAQTFTDYEIIVIDDGSKDKTGEIVKAFGDSRIKYYYQENRGLSFSRNQALKYSSGDYIAILDHDDLWEPDKLELQLKMFGSDPAIGVVYGGARVIDGEGRFLYDMTQRWFRSGRVTKDLVMRDFVPCPTIVFRRSLLDKTGLFNEQYEQLEETELLFRLSLVSDFAYVKKIVVSYRKHDANASRDIARIYKEWIQCLTGFVEDAGDAQLKYEIRRSLFFKQALFALLYIYNSMAGEAAAVMADMEPVESMQKLVYLPALKLFSLLPFGVCRLLLRPLKAKGLVDKLSVKP